MWRHKMYLLVFTFLEMFNTPLGLATFSDADDAALNFQSCICVPYWQCKEDYSGLIEDGIDIMDIRIVRKTVNSASCTGDFDVCCKLECGYRNTQTYKNIMSSRVLGENNQAEFAEFPWMVGILEDRRYRCGAALIHPQVAVTAAHCVSTQGMYKVRAGEWNWESLDEPIPHQDRMTKKVIIHQNYHSGSLRNDIALLLLQSSFIITESVGVVCIPPPTAVYDYSRCIATGWGKNSYLKGVYQPTLKKIELPIVSNEQCVISLRDVKMGPNFNLHKSFVCAGGEEMKDTCKGDGGGPLVCPIVEQPGRYQQVGIVAWGLTCGMVNTPGVYVNVALFSEWIDDEMRNNNMDTNIYKA